MTLLPVDQEAREQALSPRESFHLEAPAGSGKTAVLLARFLTLLAGVEAPEELLAVTFTRKAAGELRTRVMDLLTRPTAPGPEGSPWDRLLMQLADEVMRHFDRRGAALQEVLAPERLPVMTFHSFCAQLLRHAPGEAGLPLDFRLLEENDTERFKQEALEEMRRDLSARPPSDPGRQALVRRLVRLNNDWPRLAEELSGLLSRRDGLEDFLGLARASREPEVYLSLLESRFRLALTPALDSLAAELAATGLGQAWGEFRQELQGSPLGDILPPAIPGGSPADLAAWQAVAEVLLTKSGGPRKQLTPKYGFPAALGKERWAVLIQQLPPEVTRRLKKCRDLTPHGASLEEAAALQDLVILLGEALRTYEQLCQRQQALDFVALEQAALRLLRETTDVSDLLLRLDARLKHLLVDEFQDTSENQVSLLCRLLAGWQQGEGRTLMVVGDPKQSIYAWRQAKPRLFHQSRHSLPCRDGTSLPLTPLLLETNFRATGTLIDWANGVFGNTVMKGGIEGAAFHPARPRPDAAAGPAPALALFTGDDKNAARELEARFLAREVAAAQEDLSANGSIGILLFARTHLPVYLQTLADAGLAVRVREGLKLTDSRVAAHLHNLARALVRPQDDLSWSGVLRGPWARQSLHVLAQVAQVQGNIWPEKLRRFADESDCPSDLRELITSLLTSREQVGRRPLGEVLTDWLLAARAWTGIAAWEGAAGVANARAYLELLHAAEAGLPEATFLKADFDLQEAFQPPDPRAQDSRVEILTVHGAKGLEFDQVFLPYLDWQPLKSDDKTPPFLLEEIPGSLLPGLALARPYIQEKQSSLYLLLKDIKERRLLDEARRVFYVAVTRARRRLVLSGVAMQNDKGEWSIPANSPLGWLRQHYGADPPPPGTAVSWGHPELQVEVAAAVPAREREVKPGPELPPVWELQPEAATYRLTYPSQLVDHDKSEGETIPREEDLELPRLRGEVIHRALETVARGGSLPGDAALAAALRQSGLSPEAASRAAPEILMELQACLQDPFLAALLRPGSPETASEWLLEDRPAPEVIRRGKIDHLAFDGKSWWLLDYKTSRPAAGEEWEEFIVREREKYRPQLLAYREMIAKAKGLAAEVIRLVLYFTACRRSVEIA